MKNSYCQGARNLNRVSGKFRVLFFILVFLSLWPRAAGADWSPLIDRFVGDGFDEGIIRDLFSRPEVRFEPGAMSSKLEALIKSQSAKPATGPLPPSKAVSRIHAFADVRVRSATYNVGW